MKFRMNYGGTNNNGNLLQFFDDKQVITYTFTYDFLNRIKTAQASGADTWSESYAIDRYGNLTNPRGLNLTMDGQTNKITTAGYMYDNGGNLTNVPGITYTYDAENRVVSAAIGAGTATYSYDAEGRRVRKGYQAAATYYIYDLGGKILEEYEGGNENTNISPPAGVTVGAIAYSHVDHLGVIISFEPGR